MEKTKRKNKNKGNKKIASSLLVILGLLILLTISGYSLIKKYIRDSFGPMNKENPVAVEVNIPAASSSTKIADILYEEGLIKHPLVFKYQVKNRQVDSKLKAGDYQLSTDMSLDSIIDEIVKGSKNKNVVRFTIPEGYEIRQIADRLADADLVNRERFLGLVGDKANFEGKFPFLKELRDNQNLEGFLFPSTYEVLEGEGEEEIIGKMLREFERIYNKDLVDRFSDFDLDMNQIITLASIIEREGKLDSERPIMSAVFHNRLEEGMMLQSCATVQYILGERKEVLSTADTRIESPFNTYINEGLPPGPIASPGEASLLAAVNPADVDYLFFVLTGEDGSHTFTKTYGEHIDAKPKK